MAKRTDSNQREIVDAFRQCGWVVKYTHAIGSGFPDLLIAKGGVLKQVEVKDGKKPPSARKLTDDEAEYHEELMWAGCDVLVVTSVEDVIAVNLLHGQKGI